MKRVCAIVGVVVLSGVLSCWAQGGVSQGAATVKGSATASNGTKTTFGNADLLSDTNNVLVAVVDTSGGGSITLEEHTTGGVFVQEVASLNKISVTDKSSAKVSAEWSLSFANADEGEVVFAGTVKVDGTTILATSVSGKATGPSDRGILSITISAKTLIPVT